MFGTRTCDTCRAWVVERKKTLFFFGRCKRAFIPIMLIGKRSNIHVSLRLASTSSIQQLEPDINTIPGCISFLQSFARNSSFSKGKELHSWMLRHDLLTSPSTITSLINMYSKCNHMSHASSVFETLGNCRNVFAYNAIIAGFVGNNMYDEGFKYYLDMRYHGVTPDKFTFPCVIKGCSEVIEIRKIHSLLLKCGLQLDAFIGSALVNSYMKVKAANDAHQVFDDLPERDVVMFNAMINGYVFIGELTMALEAFRIMMNIGEANPNNFSITGCLSALSMSGDLYNGYAIHGFVVKKGYENVLEVSNALIDMYGKCRCLDPAIRIFNHMVEKDIFSWNTLLTVHQQSGDYLKTMEIFRSMLDAGVRPDLVTITTVLPACPPLTALLHVKEIHRYMIANRMRCCRSTNNFENLLVNNILLDVYVKCGSLRYAYRIFNKMSIKDVASWNIIITGYGMNGLGNEALSMFDLMCANQIAPDWITFIGVLSACSHSGFISRGREYLSQMESVYGVVPMIEHYACVIDMLGRAGEIDEAYELLVTMPIESNDVAWRCFLAACNVHGNASLAEIASKRLLELDPNHCGNYVLMSNVYGGCGRYEEVSDVRLTMRGQNIKKNPGYSWIEVNNKVHIFEIGDRDHPEANLIYDSLDSLIAPLCEHGHAISV